MNYHKIESKAFLVNMRGYHGMSFNSVNQGDHKSIIFTNEPILNKTGLCFRN